MLYIRFFSRGEAARLTEICNHPGTFHLEVIIEDAILAFHNRPPLQLNFLNSTFGFYWILYISIYLH